jgi:hypothetical protein
MGRARGRTEKMVSVMVEHIRVEAQIVYDLLIMFKCVIVIVCLNIYSGLKCLATQNGK